MKNILIYYIAIILPLLIIMAIGLNLNYPLLFAALLILYWMPYRAITDGLRLERKGLITRKDMWKLIIPGYRVDYIKELYFKK